MFFCVLFIPSSLCLNAYCLMLKNRLVTILFYGLHEYPSIQAKIISSNFKWSNLIENVYEFGWIVQIWWQWLNMYTVHCSTLNTVTFVSLLFMLSIFALNLHVTFALLPLFWQQKQTDCFLFFSFPSASLLLTSKSFVFFFYVVCRSCHPIFGSSCAINEMLLQLLKLSNFIRLSSICIWCLYM